MARTVFVLFSVFIILMGALLITSNSHNIKLEKQIKENYFLIDSLQSECSIKDLTIGRDEFIIQQLKEKYPTEIKKIDDETE
jgi:hypothetical protein